MTRIRTAVLLAALLGAPAGAQDHTASYWYAIDHITEAAPNARVVVWAPLPPDWHGQDVAIGDIEPAPVAVLEDPETGNRVVEWLVTFDSDQPPPLNRFLHFDFTLTEKPVRVAVDPAQVRPYATDDELYGRYTRAETWLQTRGPVLDTAREITRGEEHPWHRAGRIYDWIVANVRYESPGPADRDAESVLAARRGDCEQFSVLMVAMLRSLGVPARTVTAAWPEGGDHVFLEFWLEGPGWVPADPSLGQMLGPDGGGFAPEDVARMMDARDVPLGDPRWLLGNLFAQRLVMIVGNNITVDSPTLGRPVTFQSLRSGGRAAQPDAHLVEGLNRDVVHGAFLVAGAQPADEEAVHELAHRHLAERFFRVGMYDVVEDVCRSSLATDRDGIMPWLDLGRVYLHKGDYYKAEAALKRALAGQSARRDEVLDARIWVHNYLGNCYDLLGQRDMARAEYRKVVELGNNHRGAVDFARRYLETPFSREALDR